MNWVLEANAALSSPVAAWNNDNSLMPFGENAGLCEQRAIVLSLLTIDYIMIMKGQNK